MKTAAEVKVIEQKLKDKGVKYCIGAYVDIHGIPKGKVVPIDHFPQMSGGSERYTGYALDGLGQGPSDDEITSVPDLDHIIPLPWEPKVAWMPADNYFQGNPYSLNTRVALKNVLAEAVKMGFGMNLGIECEIYLFKQNADGSLSVPNPDDKLGKAAYDVSTFMDNFTWLDKMATAMNGLGWDLYSFDHEDGNSQFEFDFNYSDALTMCDRFIFFRYMAKHYAKEEGLLATTMPKPFADKTGTGAHFNMSLYDLKTGKNLFACDPKDDLRGLGLTTLGYQFIAGILKHGPALCATFAPTVNSYKRVVRRGAMNYFSWAPVFNSFGSNNRTNSVRVPMGGGRCESRNADGSVNPYLAATLALAAGLEGIKESLDPGKPNEDNLYEMTEGERTKRGIGFLPQTLQEAVKAFAADPLVEKTLGKELSDEFIKYKTEEWEAYHQSVSQWEISRYAGCRAYLAVQGGFDVPDYLGSKSTFTPGQFGGHGGRSLRVGDVLHLAKQSASYNAKFTPQSFQPHYSNDWEVGVLYGPHGAPDFFTEADIALFFSTEYEVHYNSNTTGIRLIGPKPEWARKDGGEAGLHPSNIHDNAYAIGSIDFTGDMPIILGPDGPSLGGFVCPAVIAQAELWKMGQLKAGDKIRFVRLNQADAAALETAQNKLIAQIGSADIALQVATREAKNIVNLAENNSPILAETAKTISQIKVVYRQAGDKYLLIEYGELVLDLNLRFRVHALMQWLEAQIKNQKIQGITDLTPGIRSLQVHFESLVLPVNQLIQILQQAEGELPSIDAMQVPTRIVHLPLSWEDPSIQLAITKYTQSVRKDAPWCAAEPKPNNTEFIRRINGLDSVEQVKDIVFNASYLTLGLGDVYLGAPVATPLDPRHRLVTTKYNPARTWTPENAVDIGGAYMCVYGMEGPGGYQFVGRTIQMWNRWNRFAGGNPWLLQFFDQIRFYEVTAEELLQMREDFPRGKFELKIEEQTFSLKAYNQFLKQEADSIYAFKAMQQAAFEAERERWVANGQSNYNQEIETEIVNENALEVPDGHAVVSSHVAGNLWQIKVKEGDNVDAGDVLVIVESMKMEITVTAPYSGRVSQLICREASAVAAGQALLLLEART